jgi:SpoVK/Ycf46/Vps4 family AAA+-type ATPase
MADRCSITSHNQLSLSGSPGALRFSRGQLDLIQWMVRDVRAAFPATRFRNIPGGSQGALVLLSGPKGTGKTMAAEFMAQELGVQIFRVKLNEIVSRYIGETEKNLSRVLDRAGHQQMVLLIEEADALFAKRSPVRDRHDRYGNSDVSLILETLKTYPGLVVLSSNQPVDSNSKARCQVTHHLNFSPPIRSPRLRGQ